MFGWFKRKNKENINKPQIVDINNNPLTDGDIVMAMRYNLGKCQLITEEDSYFYKSVESGKKVSWLKMIDASTAFQKVEKIGG